MAQEANNSADRELATIKRNTVIIALCRAELISQGGLQVVTRLLLSRILCRNTARIFTARIVSFALFLECTADLKVMDAQTPDRKYAKKSI